MMSIIYEGGAKNPSPWAYPEGSGPHPKILIRGLDAVQIFSEGVQTPSALVTKTLASPLFLQWK